MSTLVATNLQVGSDGTATNNFTVYQPSVPDGTLRIGNGNSGSATSRIAITSAGDVGIGTSSPATKLHVNGGDGNQIRYSGATNIIGMGMTGVNPFIGSLTNAPLLFLTNAAETMRLDSSGNLGLGVTPGTWAAAAKALDFTYPAFGMDGNGAAFMSFNARNSTGSTWVYKTTDEAGKFTVTTGGGFTWETAASGTAGNAITFTQAMTLDASGNLLVGQTSSAAGRIQVGGFNDATYVSSTGIGVNGNSHFQGNLRIGGLAGAGSRAVNADANGTLSAASDESLKQEVTDAHLPGLAEVLQLQPKAYKWLLDIENRGDEAAVEIGFFANQVAPIIPSAAPKGNDGLYGFYDRSVTAALVKAIQEQQAIITALTARLAAAGI